MRYSRQEIVIGKDGQKKLSQATVAVLGLGAVGSVAAELLARSGTNLLLIDRDVVEESNLQRQLYDEDDVDKPKAIALKERLASVNSRIRIGAVADDFNASNAEALLTSAHFVVDGLDNLYSRFLLNDACMKRRIPFTYSASVGTSGIVSTIAPGKTACLRCFLPNPSPGALETCETAGILAPASATVGALAAGEAMQHLAGNIPSLAGELLSIDVKRASFDTATLPQRHDCPACNGAYTFLEEKEHGMRTAQLCGTKSYYVAAPKKLSLDLHAFAKQLGKICRVQRQNAYVLQLACGSKDVTLFRNGKMIVRNASNENEAKSAAARILSS
ncbi:MAG: ThiF family adenylyltransferase [Candidatus Aenigmarchaeota archaeon]|nr:ThiF family adenylyltransferase [Candidatus Aenigmarchaeota archaeon]